MIKKLRHITRVEIIPTSPFHFDSTVYKPGHFPGSDAKWEPGKRWQTMVWEGEASGLILENVGSVDSPRILLHIYSDKPLPQDFVYSVLREVNYRYNLQLDLGSFYNRFQDDTRLAPVFQKFRGLRPMHSGSLYEYLIIAIILQNATVRRTVNMMQALFEKYGRLVNFDNKNFFCFWEPRVLAQRSEQELRELKVGWGA